MACYCNNQTLAGLCKDCEGSVGGIVTVYAIPWSWVKSVSVGTATTGTDIDYQIITAITFDTAVTAATFYEYQLRKNTGSMTSTLNVTDDGNVYVSTELSLVFSKMETKKRIEMNALAVQDLAIIVKDANGKYWYLGETEPVNASAGEGATGTNRTDSNHYGITFTALSPDFPKEVAESALNGKIEQATN